MPTKSFYRIKLAAVKRHLNQVRNIDPGDGKEPDQRVVAIRRLCWQDGIFLPADEAAYLLKYHHIEDSPNQ
jgi:hypothetical protein